MRNIALTFLVASSFFLTSCSSFAFGKKCPCEDLVLPPKPQNNWCVALSDGRAYCPDTDQTIPAAGLVCRTASDDDSIWLWIQNAIDQVNN